MRELCVGISTVTVEETAGAALQAALDLARSGDLAGARERCAEIIFRHQPLLAVRKDLLCLAYRTLLAARGYKLLSRLAMTVNGQPIAPDIRTRPTEESLALLMN